MSPDPRWLRVQSLFDTASSWPPDERAARLSGVEPDGDVRAEVLGLLEAAAAEEQASRNWTPPQPQLPDRIGQYRILALAGAGGRGRVYQAEHETAGVSRRVAVKVMADHLVAPADLARFEREQRVLLSLNHPFIARFLESGWDERQRPYMVMEWVEGVPINEYASEKTLPQADRIRLVVNLLDALQAAHRSLVVHLDLKPSNVLVDTQGKIRVLDFGTAKLLHDDDATSTQQLTPRYASPERLRAEPVTTACDVYSVGLLLHELLTGRWPFRESGSIAGLAERAAGTAELRIRTGTPDLDAVLLKALQFDPNQRYSSAADFAADLRAVLDSRPVSARRPTRWYRLSRFVARNRAAFATGTIAFALLTSLGVYAVWQQLERNREATRSRQIAAFLRWLVTSSAVPGSGRPTMTVVEMVERGHRRLSGGTALPDDNAADIQADFAYLTQEHGREDLAEPMARDALLRADRSGQPDPRLKARSTLATIVMRGGRCPEALSLFQSGDPILAARPAPSPASKAGYLLVRASAAEQCEAKPADAIRLVETAINEAKSIPAESFTLAPEVFRASAQLQYALFLARAGRHADAVRAADAGLALAASHSEGRYYRIALLRIRSQAYSAAGNAAAALADIREAARLAPGVVNPFEETRMLTLVAGRTVDTGDRESAARQAREAVALARTRTAAIGPSFWMILADAAEVLAKCGACTETMDLYREADALTKGRMPRTWRGNRLFFEAECARPQDPARAARLAREALDTYGQLLPAASKRRARLMELLQSKP